MIVQSEEQYQKVIKQAIKDQLIALDAEAEMFDKKAGKTHAFDLALDGFGIYSTHVKAYIPAKFLDQDFQQVLNNCSIVFHNAKFDLTLLEKEGYKIDDIEFHDTMIMSWLLDENRRSFGLKNLAKSILKYDVDDVTEFKDVGERPTKEGLGLFANEYEERYKIWEEKLGKYCIDDCKYTYQLYKRFEPKIKEQGMWKIYTELEIPMILVLRSMENRGITLDLDYLRKMGNKIEERLVEIQAEIWKQAGKEFDINSSQQLSQILFDEMGYSLPADYLTATGKPSTNVQALKYLADKEGCKLVGTILEYREMFKLYSTYIQGLIDRAKDGVIHGSFHQHGTVTGRLSSSNPNMQNFPRRDDEYDIRKAFVARPGYTFVISDLSQIELRLLAYFSKDTTLLNAYQNDKDIHQETADAIGCERVVAKTINFGLAYGRTAYGMSKALGMDPDEAQAFIDKYFEKFADLKVFFERAKLTMRNKGYVSTLLNRRRRFPEFKKAIRANDWKTVQRCERQTVNAIIQGSAADMMKVQMRNIWRRLPEYDAHLLVQIHDEVIIEVPEKHAQDVMELVKYEMENAIDLKIVPIKTDPEISPRWKK